MTQIEAQKTANTIRHTLNTGGIEKVWSWGAHAWRFGIENGNPFLLFRVRGLLYKGLVRIFLMGNDTFIVQLVKKVDNKLVPTKELTDVYNTMLTDLIDGWVEYTGDKNSYKQLMIKQEGKKYVDFAEKVAGQLKN